ncbi:acyl-CoA N-acyltransferase [Microthyrium microscopicum]|uniref:Acyl-CoA N-acyltransferase n=1 Tax=Microthyrium microscopicum TaxID=703497 RepID=A0A6A6U9V6_9PEZI|nr:acyl-CoA N-acyltransferase [Microthyrium microscopicum]
MSDQPIIRFATKDDVSSILFLIKELAIFENALDSVETTEQSLLDTLSFPNTPDAVSLSDFSPGFARTFLLIVPNSNVTDVPKAHDGSVAGMALFFTNYSTWRGAPGVYLEDLYVRQQFRRKGHARLLLGALAKETIRLGGKRLEWSCLNWNVNALKFYESIGAVKQSEWIGLRTDGEALESSFLCCTRTVKDQSGSTTNLHSSRGSTKPPPTFEYDGQRYLGCLQRIISGFQLARSCLAVYSQIWTLKNSVSGFRLL